MGSEPLHTLITDSEKNKERIAKVEKLFGLSEGELCSPKRVLVGDGVLYKHCRRKIKKRRFFLFSDLLVYGNPWLRDSSLNKPHFIDLADAGVHSVIDDSGAPRGFSILSPKRSFTVYTCSQDEACNWILHLVRCISEARAMAGRPKNEEIFHSPVWIPDSAASHCMQCSISQFTFLNRRHHCRHCGKVVCSKCSTHRVLLAYQSSERVRVCDHCYQALQRRQARIAEVILDTRRKSSEDDGSHPSDRTPSGPVMLTKQSTFYSKSEDLGPLDVNDQFTETSSEPPNLDDTNDDISSSSDSDEVDFRAE